MHTVIGCYGIIDRHHSAPLSYRVDVEHVDGEVVGRQVHGGKHLCEIHDLVLGSAHAHIAVSFQCFLDKSQQMFLIHAGSSVNMSVNLAKKMFLLS